MPKIAKLSFKHLGAAYLLIAALVASPSFAHFKPGNLIQFTEQDGLPGIQVNSLLQEKFGYMWVGTINGLARYDGYEFKRFYNNPNDSTSINGIRIPLKVLDKIFQAFFTTKPTSQGADLGLSLSYNIIRKVHGEELKVNTLEAVYTEFIIQLNAI